MARRFHVIALGFLCSAALAAPSFAAGTPQQKCAATKMKAAGKALGALSKCSSKALGAGTDPDSECVLKAGEIFHNAFVKADGSYDDCLHEGDDGNIAAKIFTVVDDITGDLGCGNGRIDGDEACDDNDTADGDGCSSACEVESGFNCTGTPSVCTVAAVCGDGVTQMETMENCDDGNAMSGDGCSFTCMTESGFQCAGQPSVCSTVCSDGIVAGPESCDDGNFASGDGCSGACSTESGYQCVGQPSVCTTICGDGVVTGAEACDDGNVANGDGCDGSCIVEVNYVCLGQPSVCTLTCTLNGGSCMANGECCSNNCAGVCVP